MVAPSSGPSSSRPGAGWFAVPLALLVLAVALIGVVAALRWDQRGDEPVVGRAGGVETTLDRDATYDVYAPSEAVAVGGPGSACVLNPRDGSQGGAVTLRDDRSGVRENELSRDGTTFGYVGSFTATVSGRSVVTCIAASDGMLLRARGVSVVPPVAVVGAVVLVLAAIAAFSVVTVRRRT